MKLLLSNLEKLNQHTGKQFYLSVGVNNSQIERYDECGHLEKCADYDSFDKAIEEINELADCASENINRWFFE